MVYIYGLYSSDDTTQIRYIGKAKNPKDRLRRHLQESNLKHDTHKNRWIKKCIEAGHTVNVVVVDQVQEEDWEALERFWISKYTSDGFRLTNSTLGGDGIITDGNEVIQKRGDTRRKNNIVQKADDILKYNVRQVDDKWLAERSCPTCQKPVEYTTTTLSKVIDLIKKSLERNCYSCTRQICNKDKGNKNFGDIARLRGKAIQQFTKDGQFVFEFPSINEASRVTQINKKSIGQCANGEKWHSHAGGYVFKYKE